MDWTLLSINLGDDTRPWLFKLFQENGGYSFFITDLCNLWSEKLKASLLQQRAQEMQSPFNPSQDGNQLETLLKRLKDVFQGTAAEAQVSIRSRDQETDLLIDLSCDLPKPLRPLKWNLSAAQQGNEQFRSQVLMPLLFEVSCQKIQMDILISIIAEKDSALKNILDKVDSSGLDLTNLFPIVAATRQNRITNKKDVLRSAMRGLQTFEPERFFDDHVQADKPEKITTGLLKSVFHAGQEQSRFSEHTNAKAHSQKQVEPNRPRLGPSAAGEAGIKGLHTHERGSQWKPAGITDEDPLNDSKNVTENLKSFSDDETTEDEDGLDIDARAGDGFSNAQEMLDPGAFPPSPPSPQDQVHSTIPKRGPRKLGTIGKRRDEGDDALTLKIANDSLVTKELTHRANKPSKPKLGTVGGKKSSLHHDQEPSPVVTEGEKMSKDPESLVTARNIVNAHSVYDRTQQDDLGNEKDNANGVEDAGNDPAQRADSKRTNLKRELNAKNTNQAKKKRKF